MEALTRPLVALLVVLLLAGCQPEPGGTTFRHGGAVSVDTGFTRYCAANRGAGSCPP